MPLQVTDRKQFLTVSQAAAEANVSRQYINRLIDEGTLRAHKIDPANANSPHLIERASFNRWLRSRNN